MQEKLPRASCIKAVTRQASSPPMLQYALGKDQHKEHMKDTYGLTQ